MTLFDLGPAETTTKARPSSQRYNSLTFVATLWAILLPMTALTFGPDIAPGDVLLPIAALIGIVTLAISNPTVFGHISAIVIVLALVYSAVALAAGINASDTEESTLNTIKLFVSLACALIVLMALAWVGGPNASHRVMMGYVMGSCILAISTWVSPAEVANRHVGLAGHPVEVGGTLSVAAAYLAFWQTRSKGLLAAKLLGLAVLASGFLRAETLTGPVTVALACLATAVLGARLHLKGAVTFVVAGFMAGWLFISTSAGAELFRKLRNATNLNLGSSSDSTLNERFLTMIAGIEKAVKHPLAGNGIDTSGMTAIGRLAPHNVLILAWQSGGVLLLMVYALLCVATFFCVMRLRRASDQLLLLPLAASAVASWLAAFSGPQLLQRTWLLPIIALLACSVVVARSETGSVQRRPQRIGKPSAQLR
jgi:O-antigen ligase